MLDTLNHYIADGLTYRVHSYRSLDECYRADAANLNILICVVLILAHQTHVALKLRLLNILNRDVLLAIHIYREKVHITPEYIAHVAKLLIEDDVATLEQRIHRITNDIYRAIALIKASVRMHTIG